MFYFNRIQFRQNKTLNPIRLLKVKILLNILFTAYNGPGGERNFIVLNDYFKMRNLAFDLSFWQMKSGIFLDK